MTVKILHNPRCSKSRQTLRLLRDRGVDPEIALYLDAPLSAEEVAGGGAGHLLTIRHLRYSVDIASKRPRSK